LKLNWLKTTRSGKKFFATTNTKTVTTLFVAADVQVLPFINYQP